MTVQSPEISHLRRKEAFTLIELLMVIAVILLLVGITFGITKGVQNSQARAKARAELAVIGQSLEAYKSKYGDYPWISTNSVANDAAVRNASHGVLKTLVGWQSVTGTQVGGTDSVTGAVFKKGDSTLDVSKLSLSQDWPTTNPEQSPPSNVYFFDPWGNPYVYCYKDPTNSATWERFGYILFSRGPDGKASSAGIEESTGEIEPAFREASTNVDNIFVGE